jgi:hypothetical protein
MQLPLDFFFMHLEDERIEFDVDPQRMDETINLWLRRWI